MRLTDNHLANMVRAWIALAAFMLLAFFVLITIETLTREYPKWQWWMSTAPVNVFSDAFMPVFNFALIYASIPIGLITLLLVLTRLLRWDIARRVAEIACYFLSIGFLWFGFWVTGWAANCTMLSLQSDGGPWGPCGYWAWFSRPLNTFIWHTILWLIWSIALIGVWAVVKRKLPSNSKEALSA